MSPQEAQELNKLVIAIRDLTDRAGALLDQAEAKLAAHMPGGDREKQRELERIERAGKND